MVELFSFQRPLSSRFCAGSQLLEGVYGDRPLLLQLGIVCNVLLPLLPVQSQYYMLYSMSIPQSSGRNVNQQVL